MTGVDANFGFLARHLLLTELHPGSAGAPPVDSGAGDSPANDSVARAPSPVEILGGIEVTTSAGVWLGLWDSAALGDVEQYVLAARQRAGERGLAGAVCLAPVGAAAQWDELAEALYVYGLPEAPGPGEVMVLANPPHPKPRGLRFLPVSESPGAFEIACGSVETTGELTGPAWPDAQATCELLDVQVAWHDTHIVGAVGTYSTDLATRIALLWTGGTGDSPVNLSMTGASPVGGRDLAQALVEHAWQQAQSAGRLLVCAWAKKQGLLRFALAEAGFAEQVTARFFAL